VLRARRLRRLGRGLARRRRTCTLREARRRWRQKLFGRFRRHRGLAFLRRRRIALAVEPREVEEIRETPGRRCRRSGGWGGGGRASTGGGAAAITGGGEDRVTGGCGRGGGGATTTSRSTGGGGT